MELMNIKQDIAYGVPLALSGMPLVDKRPIERLMGLVCAPRERERERERESEREGGVERKERSVGRGSAHTERGSERVGGAEE